MESNLNLQERIQEGKVRCRGIEIGYGEILRGMGYKDFFALFDELASQKKEIRWLDYCCGKGFATLGGVKGYNPKDGKSLSALAVDILPDCRLPKTSKPRFEQGKALFLQHDLEESLPNARADLISCVYGLDYLTNPLFCIDTMFKQLETNGVLLFTLMPTGFVNGTGIQEFVEESAKNTGIATICRPITTKNNEGRKTYFMRKSSEKQQLGLNKPLFETPVYRDSEGYTHPVY